MPTVILLYPTIPDIICQEISCESCRLVVVFCRMIKLRELRLDKFLTQAELAKKAGISRDTVNQVENSRQKPSLLTIRKLAKVLGVEPGEIEF